MHRLIPHPASMPKLVTAVSVEMIATVEDLLLTYTVTGQKHSKLPAWASSQRRSELWKTTCFELFIRDMGREGYSEFNFSPSTEWAAYRFDNYRAGMVDMALSVNPFIERGSENDDYIIEVDVDLSDFSSNQLSVALSAVIEEVDGTMSYWSLAHPPGKPDFHHPDCFTLQLEAAPRP